MVEVLEVRIEGIAGDVVEVLEFRVEGIAGEALFESYHMPKIDYDIYSSS